MIFFTKFKLNNYIAITIYPFIFIHKEYKEDKVIVNHEKIHLKQQVELLWIGFFIWYVVEFLIKLVKYKNWHLAYRNISFEKEAYVNETNLEYIQNRKFFSFMNYFLS
jgi:hypothetical protein